MVKSLTPNPQKLIELGKAVLIRAGVLPFILVAILVIFGVWNPVFLSSANMFMVSRSATYLIVLTLAQMLALLSAGLDLSLGAAIALISVVSAMVMVALQAYPGVDVFVGVLAGIGVGALVGATNGFIIAFFQVSPFLVTLGMSYIALALSLTLSRGVPIWGLPGSFVDTLGTGTVLGVAVPVIVTILLVGVMYFILSWTRFGHNIYALGGNPEAAIRAGISFRRYTFLTYMTVGILVGLAGVMLTARVGYGEPTLGLPMPLLSIAAAVLGGVSLLGGEGKLYGAILGAAAITLLRNGMDVVGISSIVQMVIVGVVLVIALALEEYRRRLR
jgi:ribose transport system permease protein